MERCRLLSAAERAGRRRMPVQPTPTLGQILDGRFLIVEIIGRGGMATILKAKDLADGSGFVAVKYPLPLFASGIGSWSMFQREEEIGRRLDHPYILKFLPLPADKHRSYLVTEFAPGPTLADRLAGGRALPESEALTIASQLCEAVDHLHQRGLVHYDVKPANVILCPDGSVRLIDLGLAHAAAKGPFSRLQAAPPLASSDYAAPEQIRRQRGQKSADIYALGATLYEMLTGQPPFPGDDPFVVASARTIGDPRAPRAVNPKVSTQAEEIALRALRRRPEERYASAGAMKADLDDPSAVAVSGIALHLKPVTRWGRYRRLVRYAFFVAILPVAVQVVVFALMWWRFAHKR